MPKKEGNNQKVQLIPEDEEGIRPAQNIAKEFEVADITAIDSNLLENAKCGDQFIKLTGNQKHVYKVSYKEEHQGICLTYTDASVVETVSYDYTQGAWVYNSTDITPLGGSGGTKLYKHTITFSASDESFTIVVATPDANAYANFMEVDFDKVIGLMSSFYENQYNSYPIGKVFKWFPNSETELYLGYSEIHGYEEHFNEGTIEPTNFVDRVVGL